MRKRDSLFPELQQVREGNPSSFLAVWIQGISALIAVAVGVVTVGSAGLSPLWNTLLLALAALLILGLALPPLSRAARRAWAARRGASRLRKLWGTFRNEVDERHWLYAHMHAHSLTSLLGTLRAQPAEEDARVRLRVLQAAIAWSTTLDGLLTHLVGLVEGPWPGATRAKIVVQLFEGLMAAPDAAGIVRELSATDGASPDRKLIDEWTTRYKNSVEQYGRWARDQNRELGERTFREHF